MRRRVGSGVCGALLWVTVTGNRHGIQNVHLTASHNGNVRPVVRSPGKGQRTKNPSELAGKCAAYPGGVQVAAPQTPQQSIASPRHRYNIRTRTASTNDVGKQKVGGIISIQEHTHLERRTCQAEWEESGNGSGHGAMAGERWQAGRQAETAPRVVAGKMCSFSRRGGGMW